MIAMANPVYDVLFLCTGNSARSILAESILNQLGMGRFRAYSAGSYPKGEVHPAAISLLKELHQDTTGFRSKSWDEFAKPGAPELDFVFTVCDNAAGEVCPAWPGQPMTVHWGIEDPAAVEGDRQKQAFWNSYQQLRRRIELFLALPLDSIDELSLRNRLKDIGQITDIASADHGSPVG
jgi:protein-tyrosine-phosphatase